MVKANERQKQIYFMLNGSCDAPSLEQYTRGDLSMINFKAIAPKVQNNNNNNNYNQPTNQQIHKNE